nr:dienelactone hydrolase family protein [Micromonospora sp. DSM 115978]
MHEMWGLNDDMRAKAARFAAEGYAALAPDLFSRGPWPDGASRVRRGACVARTMYELAAQRPGKVDADVVAARRWLAERSDVDGSRIAVVGFCAGGGFALVHGVA